MAVCTLDCINVKDSATFCVTYNAMMNVFLKSPLVAGEFLGTADVDLPSCHLWTVILETNEDFFDLKTYGSAKIKVSLLSLRNTPSKFFVLKSCLEVSQSASENEIPFCLADPGVSSDKVYGNVSHRMEGVFKSVTKGALELECAVDDDDDDCDDDGDDNDDNVSDGDPSRYGSIHSAYIRFLNAPGNKITIKASVEYLGNLRLDEPLRSPATQQIGGVSLKEVLFSEKLSDVTIVCADEEKVPAHRVILASRCSVFSAVFQSKDWQEEESRRVEIGDFALPVVRDLLRYIYTGELEHSLHNKPAEDSSDESQPEEGHLRQLLLLADKYLMDDLCQICVNGITARISSSESGVAALCDALVAGSRLPREPKTLLNTGLEFLRRHRLQVYATNRWKRFAEEHAQEAAEATLNLSLYERHMLTQSDQS